jgi:hypothetical protein
MHLAAVAGSHDQEVEFCSYCGRLGDGGGRVCSSCGLGVRLRTDASVLRSPGALFLVVRADGVVSAASASAERLLEAPVGRPVSSLLSAPELPSAVALAAAGHPNPVTLYSDGMMIRVASCGPPPAALVVLERV